MRCYVLLAGHMIPIAFLRSCPLKLHENGDGVNMKQITKSLADTPFVRQKIWGFKGILCKKTWLKLLKLYITGSNQCESCLFR